MPKPTRNQIYDSVIRRMVRQAIEEQERLFAQTHKDDPDQTLLQILADAAGALGHTPWPGEFVGGMTILLRFETWQDALIRAGLEMPTHPNRTEQFQRYQQEVQHQKLVYRQHKAEKKQKAQERLRARESK